LLNPLSVAKSAQSGICINAWNYFPFIIFFSSHDLDILAGTVSLKTTTTNQIMELLSRGDAPCALIS